MKYNLPFGALFASAILFMIACRDNNNTQTTAEKIDSSSASVKPNDKPAFDTSRSVTTISPGLYTTLADTLNIKIIRGVYKPGDSSIMHAHPDFALYVLEGSTAELTMTDGTKQTIDFKKDMAVVLPAATHSAKNIGKSTLRLVVVEINRPRE